MFERLRARLRRRNFLGGVAGATVALAGSEGLESYIDETAKESDVTTVPSRGRATGSLHPPEYGMAIRGARRPAWLVRLCQEDCTTSVKSFEPIGDELAYGLVPAPAGTVPVLRVVVALHNDTRGERTAFRLTTSGRCERDLDPLITVETDGSTDVNRLYDEIYLNETQFGTSFKSSLNDATLEGRLRVTGGSGTLRSGSTVTLVYEVVDTGTDGDRVDRKLGGGH